MVRALASLLCLALAACAPEPALRTDHVLRGYTVVDPAARTALQRDIYVLAGKLSFTPPKEAATLPVRQGAGQWLIPALQDCRVAPWGNPSTMHYEKLYQDMGVDTLLKAQLYCGVGRVVVAFGGWKTEEMIKRMRLLGIPGAEGLRGTQILRGLVKDSPSANTVAYGVVTRTADVAAALESGIKDGAAYITISYGGTLEPYWPPVSRDVMRMAVAFAVSKGLPSWVAADSWAGIREAVDAGATVVEGLPEGPAPQGLFRRMAAKGTRFAPSLSRLDFPLLRDRGDVPVIDSELGRALLWADVRASYRDPGRYLAGYVMDLPQQTPETTRLKLAYVRQAALEGVRLLIATQSGWTPGAFQGLSVHRSLQWLAEAGVDPWTRLRAACVWPSQLLGGPQGLGSAAADGLGEPVPVALAEGAPADLLALSADPLADPAATAAIAGVCREGRWVDRSRLLPDLSRRARPRGL